MAVNIKKHLNTKKEREEAKQVFCDCWNNNVRALLVAVGIIPAGFSQDSLWSFLSAANEKLNVRDRWKEQQAGDSRGALEKLSFIDQR